MSAAPTMQGETVGLVVVAVLALVGTRMRLVLLSAGDEGRQPVDVAFRRRVALRPARLVGLALLVLRKGLCVARDIGLRLARAVRRIGGSAHRRLPLIVPVVETTLAHSGRFILRTLEVGIVLPELLLRRGDHAVIVLGVLVIILRRDRITRGLRVPRELNVFFCNVRWISANFHVRAVRFVYPDHRVVTLAVIVASAHALVLTVSHGSPVADPFIVTARRRRASLKDLEALLRATQTSAPSPAQSGGKCGGRTPLMSGSVSRSSNPLSAAYRGVAQLFLISMSASLADQRRTDEVSNPDWANHLPGHPASFVRFVRTVGSPQSCSGARYRRFARVDSWPKPSRSCPTIQVLFFSYQECGALMAEGASQGPWQCPQDRIVARPAPAPRGQRSSSQGRAA